MTFAHRQMETKLLGERPVPLGFKRATGSWLHHTHLESIGAFAEEWRLRIQVTFSQAPSHCSSRAGALSSRYPDDEDTSVGPS